MLADPQQAMLSASVVCFQAALGTNDAVGECMQSPYVLYASTLKTWCACSPLSSATRCFGIGLTFYQLLPCSSIPDGWYGVSRRSDIGFVSPATSTARPYCSQCERRVYLRVLLLVRLTRGAPGRPQLSTIASSCRHYNAMNAHAEAGRLPVPLWL